MSEQPVSRRSFFKGVTTAAAETAGAALSPINKPPKAWVIMGISWEHNDEFSFEEGEYVASGKVYFDEQEAKTECDKLCKFFFEQETPEEFQPNWDVFPDIEDPGTATWNDMLKAGFPPPYFVRELET
jgi:hypothetical protein